MFVQTFLKVSYLIQLTPQTRSRIKQTSLGVKKCEQVSTLNSYELDLSAGVSSFSDN